MAKKRETRYVHYKTITSPDGSSIKLEVLEKLLIQREKGFRWQATYYHFDEAKQSARQQTIKPIHNPSTPEQYIEVPTWDKVHIIGKLENNQYQGANAHFDNTERNEERKVHDKINFVVGLEPDKVEVIERRSMRRAKQFQWQGFRRHYRNQGDESPDPVTGEQPEVNIVHVPEHDIEVDGGGSS